MDFNVLMGKKLYILVPIVKSHKGDIRKLLEKFDYDNIPEVRINGSIMVLDMIMDMKTSPYISYDIDAVIHRMRLKPESGSLKLFAECIERAVKYSNGSNEVIFLDVETKEEFKYILKK